MIVFDLPRGTPFRVGYATKESSDDATKNSTQTTMPGHLVIEDLIVRFEACLECLREWEEPELLPDEEGVPLH